MPTPLVDLHRHLEGCVRVSTLLAAAVREGHPLAAADRPRDAMVASGPATGLLPYLAKVDDPIEVLRTPADWRQAAREAVLDAYDDGLDAVEFRFAPWFIQQRTGLDPSAVTDAIADGVADGVALTRLPVGLIGTVLRDLGPEAAVTQIELFVGRPDVFRGVDLAGNEAGYAAGLFVPAFDRARAAGLPVTIHAGEAAGPASVRDAVGLLGARRIGHGVRAAEDEALMAELAAAGVVLEVALTSNVQTGAAPGFRTHQIHTLLAAGVPVTLNTDNPRASNVTLSEEHRIAVAEAGLTPDQLETVARTAEKALFPVRL